MRNIRKRQIENCSDTLSLLGLWTLVACLGAAVPPTRGQLGASISPPASLNSHAAADPNGHDTAPAVATDGRGTWIAVWQFSDTTAQTYGLDQDILISRSTDNGHSWSAAAPLNADALTDQYSDTLATIAADGRGNWIVVWSSSEVVNGLWDHDLEYVRSGDNGVTWTAPAFLNTNAATDTANDTYPHLATDRIGNWIVVWESVDADYDILMARSSDGGASWTAPRPMPPSGPSDNDRTDRSPRVATDRLGNWLVAWESDNSLGGGIGNDPDILLLRSSDQGATWTAPLALNTDAASDAKPDTAPDLAADATGHWVAVWRSNYSDLASARSHDHGATWNAPKVVGAAIGVGSARIAVDGQGNWVVGWEAQQNTGPEPTDYDLQVSRSTDRGLSWTTPEPLNTNAGTDVGDDRYPGIASSGAGRWLAVWSSSDDLGGTIGKDFDILHARFELPPGKSLTWFTIDGGGQMRSAAGNIEISGTIGQPDAYRRVSAGAFELTGGYWFEVPPGDANADGGVNLADYAIFADCLEGPLGPSTPPPCRTFDMDSSARVDLADFAELQTGFRGR